MILNKNNIKVTLLAIIIAVAFSACKKFKGDVTVPSYIHIESISVEPQDHSAPSHEEGFYTSKIDACQVIALFEGEQAETTLGAFQLPCTIPVLHYGKAKYIRILPVVKQNGSTSTRIYYPFFQRITLNDITLAPDSTVDLGNLKTNYYTREDMTVVCEDYFEPTTFSSHFDSTVVWVNDDPENACTGTGYGLVTIPDTANTIEFAINDKIDLKASYLYLEMDYITDLELYVNMLGHIVTSTGTSTVKSVICLHPNNKWNKIYINLGRTWSQFNYNTPIQIYFQVANPKKVGGHVKLDNVKILAA